MAALPPSLKPLLSVVKRAEELEKSSVREERVVAYYCRLYAATKAMKLAKAPNETEKGFIGEQISKLEQLKPSLNASNEEGERICRQHANNIFGKADDVDRSGLADKGIAKLFYAAGTFFDILEQFGELDSEVSAPLVLLIYSSKAISLSRFLRRRNMPSGRQLKSSTQLMPESDLLLAALERYLVVVMINDCC